MTEKGELLIINLKEAITEIHTWVIKRDLNQIT